MDNVQEIWRPIPGYEGSYSASNLGRIRSEARSCRCDKGTRKLPQKVMVLAANRVGYRLVNLRDGLGGARTHLAHKLVALTFLGPREEGLQINHRDLDKSNNCVWNLEYVTAAENTWHERRLNPERSRGENVHNARLTEEDVRTVRKLRGVMSERKIAAHLGIHRSTVSHILTDRIWRHVED